MIETREFTQLGLRRHEEYNIPVKSLAERVLEHVIDETADPRRGIVLVEGPPLYLWPHSQRPYQNPEHPAFRGGWEFTDRVVSQLPDTAAQHWALVDDYNNRPAQAIQQPIKTSIEELLAHAAPGIRVDTAFWERSFVEDARYRQYCSDLDARFQFQKLQFALNGSGRTPLLIVVHPHEFRAQQERMIGILPRLLSNVPDVTFQNMPKQQKRDAIGAMYRHVWINDEGVVDSFTHPVWNGGQLSFEEVEL